MLGLRALPPWLFGFVAGLMGSQGPCIWFGAKYFPTSAVRFDECTCFTSVNELAVLPIVTFVYMKKANKGGTVIPLPGEAEVRGSRSGPGRAACIEPVSA